MKRNFLLSLLAMVVGFFSLSAENVMIDVDNAANVEVTYGYDGAPLALVTGMNRITELTAADNPLTIRPANGATIVSVTKNESEAVTPSGDGVYRVAISNMKLDIVTSGGSAASSEVDVTVNNMGAPGSFTLKVAGEDMTIGSPVKMKAGTEITVIPATGYAIEKVEDLYMATVGAANEDGTYTFEAGNDPYGNFYSVYTKVTGLSFTIEPDYAPNVAVMLHAVPDESEGAYHWVNLNPKGKTTVVTTADMTPIWFTENNDSEILSVTRNGEEVRYMDQPMTWIKGYVSTFEEGDVFVVTTKGKPVDFTFKVEEGNAPLEWYFFSLADGTKLNLTGMEATEKLPLGAKVFITPRPGTELSYLGQTQEIADDKSWVRVLEDGSVTIFGTRSDKVTINVDDAARVSVRQSNGRGDAVALVNGENQFDLSALQNALSITATEGNYIVSVTLNGDEVEEGRNGAFLVSVEDGSYVDIKSRKIPGDVNVTLDLNEGADLAWLTATMNGEPLELSAAMKLKAGSIITLAPAFGYQIDDVTTLTPGCLVEKNEKEGTFTLTVGDEMESAMFSVIVNKMVAPEGYALVTIKTDNDIFYFRYLPEVGDNYELSPDKVNVVKIGDRISVGSNIFNYYIKSLVINGEEIKDASDKKYYIFTIEGDCNIELTTYQLIEVSTTNSINPEAHITIGNVYIVDEKGKRLTRLETQVGATINFEVETTVGYKFVTLEKYSPAPVTQFEGLSYTITQADLENNPNGMLMFRGVFEADEEHPSLSVRTSPCYMLDSEGKPVSGAEAVIGYVYIYTGDKEELTEDDLTTENCVTEYVAEVGSKVRLICLCDPAYELYSFCFSAGFPNSTFPGSYYTVNADDANAEGVIWITGVLRKKGTTGLEAISAEGSLIYDRASTTLTSPAGASVYSVSGALVMNVEAGETSLAALPSGIYVAVTADGMTLKFVK